MLLHEIIAANEDKTSSILIESMHPYKRSLYAYYKDLFCCEPILMVTDVMNAVQYAKIVSCLEFEDAKDAYITVETKDEYDAEAEAIDSNSMLLSVWL